MDKIIETLPIRFIDFYPMDEDAADDMKQVLDSYGNDINIEVHSVFLSNIPYLLWGFLDNSRVRIRPWWGEV